MSTSLREVIEAAGYDLSTPEGAEWLVAQEDLMDEMIMDAEEVIEAEEERLTAIRDAEEAEEERIAEREYNEKFPPEEKE